MFAAPLAWVRFAEAPAFMPFCRGCGARLPDLAARAIGCPHCGAELVRADGTRATASRLTPWLRAAAGTLVPGAGQALNGQPLRGVAVLLTCWLIVPWVWGIADAWRTAHAQALHPATTESKTC
ncbi:MAG: hypothetical protein EXS13_08395 [Planctomycetes bacterium]|nr:hypothetical protein [Planctomycetota bacterium]